MLSILVVFDAEEKTPLHLKSLPASTYSKKRCPRRVTTPHAAIV
jgi:hypothetical protein